MRINSLDKICRTWLILYSLIRDVKRIPYLEREHGVLLHRTDALNFTRNKVSTFSNLLYEMLRDSRNTQRFAFLMTLRILFDLNHDIAR